MSNNDLGPVGRAFSRVVAVVLFVVFAGGGLFVAYWIVGQMLQGIGINLPFIGL